MRRMPLNDHTSDALNYSNPNRVCIGKFFLKAGDRVGRFDPLDNAT